jgi:hypothetical protein
MKYTILMQFVPGLETVWVERLNPGDPIYAFDTLEEAEIKKGQLQAADPTRGFKIVQK